MSVIFVVAPAVAASWPLLAAAAAALAARANLRTLQQAELAERTDVEAERQHRLAAEVDIPLEDSQIVSERLAAGEELAFQRPDGILIRLYVDERRQARLHVSGADHPVAALQQAGEEFMGRLVQQYAYETIVNHLEKEGYTLAAEDVDEEGRVRLRVQRWQ